MDGLHNHSSHELFLGSEVSPTAAQTNTSHALTDCDAFQMKFQITGTALYFTALCPCFPSILALYVSRSNRPNYFDGVEADLIMAATSTFHHNDQFTAETNPKDVGYLLGE